MMESRSRESQQRIMPSNGISEHYIYLLKVGRHAGKRRIATRNSLRPNAHREPEENGPRRNGSWSGYCMALPKNFPQRTLQYWFHFPRRLRTGRHFLLVHSIHVYSDKLDDRSNAIYIASHYVYTRCANPDIGQVLHCYMNSVKSHWEHFSLLISIRLY